MIHGQLKSFWEPREYLLRPVPKCPPSVWCCEHLRFNEPNNTGPFSLAGREYIREPLDWFMSADELDMALVFGSQAGKTGLLMGGVAWLVANDPTRVFWVMPSIGLAQGFSETRWMPMLRNSPALAALIPTGAERHGFKKCQQSMGGSIVNFSGSNSPANLASVPARVIVQDEVDKFDVGGRDEADASNLADQRAKRFATPKRVKVSTPTLPDGLIWQEFLKGDQRRYFVPCPHCGKFVVLAWSAEFTTLTKTGDEAYLRWEGKTKDGWDFDAVMKTAHAECPHCKGAILDAQKADMVKRGEWRPTKAVPGYRSYHLPSLYAIGPETSFGRLARLFLEAKHSLLGLQGFINGNLAEPFERQDTAGARTEIIVRGDADPLAGKKLMTVDCQVKGPHFWFVVREWIKPGHSRLAAQGNFETWEDCRRKQLEFLVADNCVCIDSGDQTADVYANCQRWGKLVPCGAVPVWVGWLPSKGRERESGWTDKAGNTRPYMLGNAAVGHSRYAVKLLEFNGEYLLGMLAKLRLGPDAAGGLRWELTEQSLSVGEEEYRKHLAGKIEKAVADRRGNKRHIWVKRTHLWPDHLLDCEVMQLAFAMFHGLLSGEYFKEVKKP